MTTEGIARPLQDALFIGHKNLGTAVLVLMLVRIAYRLTHRPPPLPAGLPPLQRGVAAATHGLLYASSPSWPCPVSCACRRAVSRSRC